MNYRYYLFKKLNYSAHFGKPWQIILFWLALHREQASKLIPSGTVVRMPLAS